jgi:hypothetical protein
VSRITPRDKFLKQLQKTIKTSTSSTERTAALKLFHDMTFGLPADGERLDSIPLPELPVTPPRERTEYDEMAALHDCTSLMHAVRGLVAEAETFVCWRREMGESDAPNARWGEWQQKYSADLHQKHRERVVGLNALIADCGFDLKLFWDWIFTPKTGDRYPVEILSQARIELGL